MMIKTAPQNAIELKVINLLSRIKTWNLLTERELEVEKKRLEGENITPLVWESVMNQIIIEGPIENGPWVLGALQKDPQDVDWDRLSDSALYHWSTSNGVFQQESVKELLKELLKHRVNWIGVLPEDVNVGHPLYRAMCNGNQEMLEFLLALPCYQHHKVQQKALLEIITVCSYHGIADFFDRYLTRLEALLNQHQESSLPMDWFERITKSWAKRSTGLPQWVHLRNMLVRQGQGEEKGLFEAVSLMEFLRSGKEEALKDFFPKESSLTLEQALMREALEEANEQNIGLLIKRRPEWWGHKEMFSSYCGLYGKPDWFERLKPFGLAPPGLKSYLELWEDPTSREAFDYFLHQDQKTAEMEAFLKKGPQRDKDRFDKILSRFEALSLERALITLPSSVKPRTSGL